MLGAGLFKIGFGLLGIRFGTNSELNFAIFRVTFCIGSELDFVLLRIRLQTAQN